jgi:hypothetical protein
MALNRNYSYTDPLYSNLHRESTAESFTQNILTLHCFIKQQFTTKLHSNGLMLYKNKWHVQNEEQFDDTGK